MRMLKTTQGSLKVLNEHAALDLLNSIDTDRGRSIDFLQDPANLPDWAVAAGLLDPSASRRLKQRFTGEPALGERTLAEIIDLREMLRKVLQTAKAEPSGLSDTIDRLLPTPLLAPNLHLNVPEQEPERALLAHLAFSAADLLLSRAREQVRQCEAPHCDWFFLNHTGRRRWCLMQGCGNAAKARRHRARAKASA